jgi:hypothetical protein
MSDKGISDDDPPQEMLGQAYHDGAVAMRRHNRTQAFAAIRRAAEVAREAHPYSPNGIWIRKAIRAAIGSDKA